MERRWWRRDEVIRTWRGEEEDELYRETNLYLLSFCFKGFYRIIIMK